MTVGNTKIPDKIRKPIVKGGYKRVQAAYPEEAAGDDFVDTLHRI